MPSWCYWKDLDEQDLMEFIWKANNSIKSHSLKAHESEIVGFFNTFLSHISTPILFFNCNFICFKPHFTNLTSCIGTHDVTCK